MKPLLRDDLEYKSEIVNQTQYSLKSKELKLKSFVESS